VKIADFGIAKIMGGGQDIALTETKGVIGTPHYMAPEQVEKPQTVDHRADIFLVGVVFYEMLTGELPLGKFQPPSRKVVVDVRLDEVVLRALEKEPELRYQHASQVKTAVETIAATGSAGVPPAEPGVAPGSSSNKSANEPSGALRDAKARILFGGWFQVLFAVGMGIYTTPFIPFGLAIGWGSAFTCRADGGMQETSHNG